MPRIRQAMEFVAKQERHSAVADAESEVGGELLHGVPRSAKPPSTKAIERSRRRRCVR